VYWILVVRLTILAGWGGGNEDTYGTLLDGCVCCNISLRASEGVRLGDTRATKYSEMVDHRFLLIEDFIGCSRLTCFVKKCLDWEDRENFNDISDGMIVSELRWEPWMDSMESALV
jgi:hypothetical protein